MTLKFMPCWNLNLKENRGSQRPIPCFSQKAFTVHYSLVRLSGTYLMREKQTPIKLFHKALAQWTPKPNRRVQAPPLAENAGAVSSQCVSSAKSEIQWPPITGASEAKCIILEYIHVATQMQTGLTVEWLSTTSNHFKQPQWTLTLFLESDFYCREQHIIHFV